MLAMGKCVTMAYAKSMFGLRRSGFFAFGLREACAYLSCLMLVFSGYHMCSDGKFSAIVCLGSVFQALSFVLLYMKYSIFLYFLNLIFAFFENICGKFSFFYRTIATKVTRPTRLRQWHFIMHASYVRYRICDAVVC